MESVVTTLYFGAKWDAPMLDEDEAHKIQQVPTPVGEPCIYCQHPIGPDDRGTMAAVLHEGGAKTAYVHMECQMSNTSGCYFRELAGEPHEHLDDYRAEALFVLKCVNKLRASQGMSPL